MILNNNGLIKKLLDILGITINTATGNYIAFIITAAVFAVALITLMVLIFKFLVYLRRG